MKWKKDFGMIFRCLTLMMVSVTEMEETEEGKSSANVVRTTGNR